MRSSKRTLRGFLLRNVVRPGAGAALALLAWTTVFRPGVVELLETWSAIPAVGTSLGILAVASAVLAAIAGLNLVVHWLMHLGLPWPLASWLPNDQFVSLDGRPYLRVHWTGAREVADPRTSAGGERLPWGWVLGRDTGNNNLRILRLLASRYGIEEPRLRSLLGLGSDRAVRKRELVALAGEMRKASMRRFLELDRTKYDTCEREGHEKTRTPPSRAARVFSVVGKAGRESLVVCRAYSKSLRLREGRARPILAGFTTAVGFVFYWIALPCLKIIDLLCPLALRAQWRFRMSELSGGDLLDAAEMESLLQAAALRAAGEGGRGEEARKRDRMLGWLAVLLTGASFVSMDSPAARDLLTAPLFMTLRSFTALALIACLLCILAVPAEAAYRVLTRPGSWLLESTTWRTARRLLASLVFAFAILTYLFVLLWQPFATKVLTSAVAVGVFCLGEGREALRSVHVRRVLFVVLVLASYVVAMAWRGASPGLLGWSPVVVAGSVVLLEILRRGRRTGRTASILADFVLVAGSVSLLVGTGFFTHYLACRATTRQGYPARVVFGPSHPQWASTTPHEFFRLYRRENVRLLYFSDKERVGYVDLDTGRVRVSAHIEEGIDVLAFDENRKLVIADTVEVPPGEIAGLIQMDADSLDVTKICPEPPDYSDMGPLPRGAYLAGLRGSEFHLSAGPLRGARFYWFDLDRCVQSSIPTGTLTPHRLLCSSKLGRCFVSGRWAGSRVSEVTLDESGVPIEARSTWVGFFSLGMALDPGEQQLFVTRPLAASVDVLDVPALRRKRRIPSSPFVRAIAYAPGLDLLFLPEYYFGRLYVHDATRGDLIGSIDLGPFVRDAIWDEQAGELFVATKDAIYSISREDLLTWERSVRGTERRLADETGRSG